MITLAPKREKFVQNIAVGMNATRSYIEAGFSSNGAGPNAGRLIKNDQVILRLAEVRAEIMATVAEESAITFQGVINELVADRLLARIEKNPAAAIKATTELAKLHGYYEQHNTQKGLSNMTMSELVARAKELTASIEDKKLITIN